MAVELQVVSSNLLTDEVLMSNVVSLLVWDLLLVIVLRSKAPQKRCQNTEPPGLLGFDSDPRRPRKSQVAKR